MELTAARFPARVDASGQPVLLEDQDRRLWDQSAIRRGRAALAKADGGRGLGAYGLQASIAECHAVARSVAETDWHRIVSLYEALGQLTPSPIIELNRAVAVAMASGPADGLALVDAIAARGELGGTHLLPSVRGELLTRLGRAGRGAGCAPARPWSCAGTPPNGRHSSARSAPSAHPDPGRWKQPGARLHGGLTSHYAGCMATYEVTRSAFIPAPAEAIFPLINSFHEWTKWSPWETVDPTMERHYSGNDAGVGAKYAWSGNRKAGSGNMEIVESTAPSVLRVRLEFTKPFKAVNPTSPSP